MPRPGTGDVVEIFPGEYAVVTGVRRSRRGGRVNYRFRSLLDGQVTRFYCTARQANALAFVARSSLLQYWVNRQSLNGLALLTRGGSPNVVIELNPRILYPDQLLARQLEHSNNAAVTISAVRIEDNYVLVSYQI